jgi:hypothetical protein
MFNAALAYVSVGFRSSHVGVDVQTAALVASLSFSELLELPSVYVGQPRPVDG